MKIADELRKILQEDYGITSEAELDEALRRTKGLDIGIFVSRTERSIDEKSERDVAERQSDTDLDGFVCRDMRPELCSTGA